MEKKYKIKKVSKSFAEMIWRDSPQSTIFTNPDVLEALCSEVHWWSVLKGNETQCVWPVSLDKNGRMKKALFSYWQGPLWTKKGFVHPPHRTLSVTTSVYNLFIDTFIREYHGITATLHPTLLDVRAFDWWNYHEEGMPRFRIMPRYSAVLKNISKFDFEPQAGYRELRRRNLRRAETHAFDMFWDDKVFLDEVYDLYRDLVGVGDCCESEVKNNINSLLYLVDRGYGWCQGLRINDGGDLVGFVLLLNDNIQANLVLNLVRSDCKRLGVMTLNIHNAISRARLKSLDRFDFNGANSPNRGDDKHSYGAEPELYFVLNYVS